MATVKKKIFIVGISGQLGFTLAYHLRDRYLVSGACFNNLVSIPDVQCFPITMKGGPDIIESVVRMQQPDIVICAIGMTDRKLIDHYPKVADTLNIVIPVSLAVLSSRIRAKFIFFGCSEVFDGTKGNYVEEDNDFTLSDAIGKQKIAAQSYIRAQTLESTTLRIGKVLALGHPYRPSLFDKMRIGAAQKQKFDASKQKVRSYLSNRSFAKAFDNLLEGEFPNRHRLFHLGGANLTEMDFLRYWYQLMGADPKLVVALENDAKRDLSLNSSAFTKAFPAWKAESKEELALNLLEELSPAIGATKKWRKTLQIP